MGLLLGNSGWNVVAMLACLACGRPCIQINPRDPQPRIANIIAEACLPAIVTINVSAAAMRTEFADLVWIDAASALDPDLGSMLRGHDAVAAMTDSALRQIALTQPEGDIRLLGYSLGGGIAFEVASRLIAAGRSIRFFGLLDVSIEGSKMHYGDTISRTIQRIRSHRVTLHRMCCRALAKCVARFGWQVRFSAFIARNWRGRLAATQFMLRLELEEVLRMYAFHLWVDKPKSKLPIAGTLFRSKQRETSPDLGWRALMDQLEIVPISGGHLDLFLEPHLANNRSLIVDALTASISSFHDDRR